MTDSEFLDAISDWLAADNRYYEKRRQVSRKALNRAAAIVRTEAAKRTRFGKVPILRSPPAPQTEPPSNRKAKQSK